jgi:hypothetical protein
MASASIRSASALPDHSCVNGRCSQARCLIPGFDGAVFSREWKDALWDRFTMGAPQRQRRSVERYSIVKRA